MCDDIVSEYLFVRPIGFKLECLTDVFSAIGPSDHKRNGRFLLLIINKRTQCFLPVVSSNYKKILIVKLRLCAIQLPGGPSTYRKSGRAQLYAIHSIFVQFSDRTTRGTSCTYCYEYDDIGFCVC